MPNVVGVESPVFLHDSSRLLHYRFGPCGRRVGVVEQSGNREVEGLGDAEQASGNDGVLASE